MPEKDSHTLQARVVAIPESRQLDVLAVMLEKRGAAVRRYPLVSIIDRPDQEPIISWIQRSIESPAKHFIILTGEGLRRLLASAERANLQEAFIQALANTHKIVRGPKPGQALREIGLKPDLVAAEPTTEGVISTLAGMDVDACRIIVQLYGDNPNKKLIDYLTSRDVAVDSVAPYLYAPDSDEALVLQLIKELANKEIDAITFTSQPQLKRLLAIAKKHDQLQQLNIGLNNCVIAAVGPVVAKALTEAGFKVDLMPESSFFMKPMVNALTNLFHQ